MLSRLYFVRTIQRNCVLTLRTTHARQPLRTLTKADHLFGIVTYPSANMGAAASMKHVYSDAMDWFKIYFDKVSYKEDFDSLDKNNNGIINYETLSAWLANKAKDGSAWAVLSTNETILRIAFNLASKTANPNDPEEMVIGLKSFKEFLVHLFVLSILWVHFKHADQWTDGTELGSERLSFQRFKMACRTFSSAQAHEQLTDEKIKADFEFLDHDKSGTIEFAEVCKYCANFFDVRFAKKFETAETAAMARKTLMLGAEHEERSMRFIRTVRMPSGIDSTLTGTASTSEESAAALLLTASAKAHKAMDVIGEKIAENTKIATFEEIKISTEIMLGLSI